MVGVQRTMKSIRKPEPRSQRDRIGGGEGGGVKMSRCVKDENGMDALRSLIHHHTHLITLATAAMLRLAFSPPTYIVHSTYVHSTRTEQYALFYLRGRPRT